jgi:hypothetical protein
LSAEATSPHPSSSSSNHSSAPTLTRYTPMWGSYSPQLTSVRETPAVPRQEPGRLLRPRRDGGQAEPRLSRACRSARSSAASNATSPARSTDTYSRRRPPTRPPLLDET